MGYQRNMAWELRLKNHLFFELLREFIEYGVKTNSDLSAGATLTSSIIQKAVLLSSVYGDSKGRHTDPGKTKTPRRGDHDRLSPALPILAQVHPFVKGGVWTKVVDVREGQMIAVRGTNGKPVYERIVSITRKSAEQVWDIEVEGTHNFIGNDIIAHNTYLSGNTFIGGDLTATSSTITFSGLGTDMLTALNGSGNLVATSTPTAARYLATSSIASILPYASSTSLTVSQSAYFATASGNVGIGTTSPWGKFAIEESTSIPSLVVGHVRATTTLMTKWNASIGGFGEVMFGTSTPRGNTVLTIENPTGAYSALAFSRGTSMQVDMGLSGDSFIIQSQPSGARLLTIDAANVRLGVGTSTPNNALDVAGNGYISSNLFLGGTLTATSP